jgi:hypothetical protein
MRIVKTVGKVIPQLSVYVGQVRRERRFGVVTVTGWDFKYLNYENRWELNLECHRASWKEKLHLTRLCLRAESGDSIDRYYRMQSWKQWAKVLKRLEALTFAGAYYPVLLTDTHEFLVGWKNEAIRRCTSRLNGKEGYLRYIQIPDDEYQLFYGDNETIEEGWRQEFELHCAIYGVKRMAIFARDALVGDPSPYAVPYLEYVARRTAE